MAWCLGTMQPSIIDAFTKQRIANEAKKYMEFDISVKRDYERNLEYGTIETINEVKKVMKKNPGGATNIFARRLTLHAMMINPRIKFMTMKLLNDDENFLYDQAVAASMLKFHWKPKRSKRDIYSLYEDENTYYPLNHDPVNLSCYNEALEIYLEFQLKLKEMKKEFQKTWDKIKEKGILVSHIVSTWKEATNTKKPLGCEGYKADAVFCRLQNAATFLKDEVNSVSRAHWNEEELDPHFFEGVKHTEVKHFQYKAAFEKNEVLTKFVEDFRALDIPEQCAREAEIAHWTENNAYNVETWFSIEDTYAEINERYYEFINSAYQVNYAEFFDSYYGYYMREAMNLPPKKKEAIQYDPFQYYPDSLMPEPLDLSKYCQKRDSDETNETSDLIDETSETNETNDLIDEINKLIDETNETSDLIDEINKLNDETSDSNETSETSDSNEISKLNEISETNEISEISETSETSETNETSDLIDEIDEYQYNENIRKENRKMRDELMKQMNIDIQEIEEIRNSIDPIFSELLTAYAFESVKMKQVYFNDPNVDLDLRDCKYVYFDDIDIIRTYNELEYDAYNEEGKLFFSSKIKRLLNNRKFRALFPNRNVIFYKDEFIFVKMEDWFYEDLFKRDRKSQHFRFSMIERDVMDDKIAPTRVGAPDLATLYHLRDNEPWVEDTNTQKSECRPEYLEKINEMYKS